ncbi:Spermidine/putrescine transport system permease protein PotB [Paraburkholderia aspalathi]|jgi:putative spermidine/putrescine transport system permease protein|uniref:Spermidine/putrescine transport system permease protein PotB n=2 Tax=Burkholderiaceae TaxID=119060 RepID=A0ABM8S523_9BURK|nr:ABC transporter permease [Paraburkholderia aspalathi]MBK3820942.1 ABC transporter permease [Paraburkholderia aspalathi]MBK3832731.1 ABC transporter permease [Paraburkholderia aspalathi]MBK3862499.1 ABC transporter permease [Paraburkholderia aspalathi]CAE6789815.1 Spermidine/putrescine transport system permease protein PotB [Paraburkholderia aspalathi]
MKSRVDGLLYVGPATVFLFFVLFVPLAYVVYTSFWIGSGPSLSAYQRLLGSDLFLRTLWSTFQISITASVASLLLGYPIAMHLAKQTPRKRAMYMVLVLVPFWTSILVKSYAFTILLGRDGLVNQLLSAAFHARVQLPLLFNRFGVMVGMTNYLIPFIVFPVLASLLSIDKSLYRASEIMGAKPPRIFFRITLPLSLPGVAAATLSTTVMSMGFFVIPALLGGRKDAMMSNLVDFYTRETMDWNMASAIGVILLGIVTLAAMGADQFQRREAKKGVTA